MRKFRVGAYQSALGYRNTVIMIARVHRSVGRQNTTLRSANRIYRWLLATYGAGLYAIDQKGTIDKIEHGENCEALHIDDVDDALGGVEVSVDEGPDETASETTCSVCGFEAKSKRGLTNHKRKHK